MEVLSELKKLLFEGLIFLIVVLFTILPIRLILSKITKLSHGGLSVSSGKIRLKNHA